MPAGRTDETGLSLYQAAELDTRASMLSEAELAEFGYYKRERRWSYINRNE